MQESLVVFNVFCHCGRRVTSKYSPEISARKDQIGECGSISFQGGPRGNMDARITPFGSHGVPLGGPLGQQRQFHCRFTLFCCFSGRSQHSTESAPRPLSYGGRGRRRPFYFSLIVFILLPKMLPTQDKLSTKALKLQGSGAQKPFYCSCIVFCCFSRRSRRRTKPRPRPDQTPTEARPRHLCYGGAHYVAKAIKTLVD